MANVNDVCFKSIKTWVKFVRPVGDTVGIKVAKAFKIKKKLHFFIITKYAHFKTYPSKIYFTQKTEKQTGYCGDT